MKHTELKMNPLKKAFVRALGISLLTVSAYTQAADVSISVNQSLMSAGDMMTISAGADWEDAASVPVDIYVSVQLPDGNLFYLINLETIGSLNTSQPIVRNWPIQTLTEIPILHLPIFEGLSKGKYKWYMTAVRAGADPAQPGNWVAHDSAEFVYPAITEPAPVDEGPTASADMGDLLSLWFPGATEETKEPVETPSPATPELLPGALTAGDTDDNLNYDDFLSYLENRRAISGVLPFIDLSGRVTLRVTDASGQSVSNAKVRISAAGALLLETYTAADGTLHLFPQFDGLSGALDLAVAGPDENLDSGLATILELGTLGTNGNFDLALPDTHAALPSALDLMFVIDATGSMTDELEYITTELRDIAGNVSEKYAQTHVRFGLTVYRDRGDEYVVKEYPFVESLDEMQVQLTEQEARGGGDYPEAMEEALQKALQADWREGNVARTLFLIADAPPHDGKLNAMLDQIRAARQMGVRIYSIAASGVADTAEYMMRGASALTQARYLFLTDDSGIGHSHAEPTVSCYQVTKLSSLISRMIESELAGRRIEAEADEVLRTAGDFSAGVCGGI
ncbi:MAG: VWA domain-containing protein [Gammaproteobacteria bacterium]|nr:VWA domain-containing protein [Gammaproteobacteria bacterium]